MDKKSTAATSSNSSKSNKKTGPSKNDLEMFKLFLKHISNNDDDDEDDASFEALIS
jgi:hypothetical protein